MYLKIKFIILLYFFSSSLAFSQIWSPPMRVAQGGTNDLNTDSSGILWCAWPISSDSICVTFCENDSWSVPETLYSSSLDCFSFNQFIDKNGYVWIIFDDEATGFYANYYDGNQWSDWMHVENIPYFLFFTKATADTLGGVWVTWSTDYYGYFRICSNYYDKGNWSGVIPIPCDTIRDCIATSMTTDKSGNIWLLWSSVAGLPGDSGGIYVSKYDGNNWSDPIFVTGCSVYMIPKDITSDKDGTIWVSWWEVNYDTTLIYTVKYDGVVWSEPMLIYKVFERTEWPIVNMISDSEGKVWLVWHISIDNIKYIYYSYWNGIEWSSPMQVDTLEGRGPAITYNRNSGRIWVVWTSNREGYPAIYASYTQAVGVEEEPVNNSLQMRFSGPQLVLGNAFFSISLTEKSDVRINVFDLSGRNVRTLYSGEMSSGDHHVQFDGTDISSGVYFITANVNGDRNSLKFHFVK